MHHAETDAAAPKALVEAAGRAANPPVRRVVVRLPDDLRKAIGERHVTPEEFRRGADDFAFNATLPAAAPDRLRVAA